MSNPISHLSSSSNSHSQSHEVSQKSGRWSVGPIISGIRLAMQTGRFVYDTASALFGYGSEERVNQNTIRDPKAKLKEDALKIAQEFGEAVKHDPKIMAALDELLKMEPRPQDPISRLKIQEKIDQLEQLVTEYESKNISDDDDTFMSDEPRPGDPGMAFTRVYDSDSE